MYDRLCGWIAYRPEEREAVEAAIAASVQRADDPASAAALAAHWRYVDRPAGPTFGPHFVFWAGLTRGRDLGLIRSQVDAIAAAIETDGDWLPDGRPGYGLQGLFDMQTEAENPASEWRVYAGVVHEREREIPTWVEPGGWDTSRCAPRDPAV